jgi:hypothetical protein
MTISDPMSDLRSYLQEARDAMLWKLDGLSEYDARRPLTPTGTNLLGLVKHLAMIEIGYFGDTFGRPLADPPPWSDPELAERDPTADLWATPEESREYITDWYQRAWAHADATFDALDLDAIGWVPWWPGEHSEVTLHKIMVHVVTETHRHAGHADIVRELIDGAAGLLPKVSNLPERDERTWQDHCDRLEQAARQASGLAR